jgi:NAD(P)-dependent dehydrogenase (short-subunit alcohol dehydrogenase family)
MRFDGKFGLVTGAGSGIGRATAIGFAQRGGGWQLSTSTGLTLRKSQMRLTPRVAKRLQ